jgi:hypothetical protein
LPATRLGPALGGIFPPGGAGGLRSGIDRRLRNPDGLLGRRGGQSRLIVITGFLVFRKKRRGNPQRFYLFFQPGELKLFLSQNLVNVLHASAPGDDLKIGTIKSNFISCFGFVKKEDGKVGSALSPALHANRDPTHNNRCASCGGKEVYDYLGAPHHPNFGSKFAILNMEIRIAVAARLMRISLILQAHSRIHLDINPSNDFTFLRLNLS